MKFLTKVKEIKSRLGVLHFQRYAVIETDKFAVYIHKIHEADKDLHLHSHPWNFISLILKGSYIEKFLGKDLFWEDQEFFRIKSFLSFSKGNRSYFHKIERIRKGPVYSLFVTWGKHQNWFYKMEDGSQIESDHYRLLKQQKNSTK